jgi:hypothetical protein
VANSATPKSCGAGPRNSATMMLPSWMLKARSPGRWDLHRYLRTLPIQAEWPFSRGWRPSMAFIGLFKCRHLIGCMSRAAFIEPCLPVPRTG